MILLHLIKIKIRSTFKKIQTKDFFCRRAKVLNRGSALFHKNIIGHNNYNSVLEKN
jgi:hypothetical protein